MKVTILGDTATRLTSQVTMEHTATGNVYTFHGTLADALNKNIQEVRDEALEEAATRIHDIGKFEAKHRGEFGKGYEEGCNISRDVCRALKNNES